tara:strand:- start:7149 stop:7937 length:789 start_codon:yes stop_codon:yes gene_type:complete
MKIAVCFFGHTGSWQGRNVSDSNNPKLIFDNYKKYIFRNFDTDIFVHTWSKNFKNEIEKELKPKLAIYEDQKDFSQVDIKKYEEFMGFNILNFSDRELHEKKEFIFRTHSRWYSNSKSLQLMTEYSKKKNIKYDWVVQIRFDLFFFKKFRFNNLDKNKFYSPRRDHEKSIAINDHYFISNYNNAIKFSSIIDHIFELPIRPPCAAKKFLENLNIKNGDHFDVLIDFFLIRWIHKDYNKIIFKIKRLCKVILRIFGIRSRIKR